MFSAGADSKSVALAPIKFTKKQLARNFTKKQYERQVPCTRSMRELQFNRVSDILGCVCRKLFRCQK